MSLTPAAETAAKPLHAYPTSLQPTSTTIAHCGLDSTRYNSISYLGDNTVLSSGGKFILFLHLDSGAIDAQPGPADGAVGVVAVHPSKLFYLVGDRRPANPLLQAYSWPLKKAAKTFTGGAEVGYAALAFSGDGSRLASVASEPDYTLAVWDWATATLLLRSKCFGTDVFSIAFSRFDDSLLVSGGAGHIKCWAMANTFTGKKLQGSLGKFGRHEISDVVAFVVLADGKVLSGSDCGDVLLWEGDLIVCTFARAFTVDEDGANGVGQTPYDVTPCHDGAINYVGLFGDVVVTAGEDGFMRYWRLQEMEGAHGKGLPPYYAPACVHEVCVGPSFRIRSVCHDADGGRWILMDSFGSLATLVDPLASGAGSLDSTPAAEEVATTHFELNGAALTCAAVSPRLPLVLTGGADGVVRCCDAVLCTQRCRLEGPREPQSAPAAVVAVSVLDALSTGDCTRAVVGYADGVLRLVEVPDDCRCVGVVGQWKAHAGGLVALVVNAAATRLATVSSSGDVFFFDITASPASLTPLGFCTAPLARPTCAAWDADASGGHGGCFLGYSGGELLSVAAPAPGSVDLASGFAFPCAYELVAIRQRQRPPPKTEAEELDMAADVAAALQEEDVGPWAINFVVRLPGEEGIAVGMAKEELAYLYRGTVRYANQLQLPPLPATGVEPPNYVEDPQMNLCYRNCVPQAAFVSPDGALVMTVTANQLLLREAGHRGDVALLGAAHDSTSGAIAAAYVCAGGALVVSAGADGTLVTQLRAGHSAPPPLPTPAIEGVAVAAAEAPALSVQEQKEADDAAQAAAEKAARLEHFLQKLAGVRASYDAIVARNAALPPEQQLSAADMELDASLRAALEVEKKRLVTEAEKEFALTTLRGDIMTEKLRNRFVSNLLCERFQLFAIDEDVSVASFRLRDPQSSIARLTAAVQQLENSDGATDTDASDSETGAEAPSHATEADYARIGDAKGGSAGVPVKSSTNAPHHNSLAALPKQQPTPPAAGGAGEGSATADFVIGATVKQQLDKMDARRLERLARRRGYDALVARKPSAAVEDAALARQLEQDLKERGECTFRTDAAYRSEYPFRPTAVAKLQRMIFLMGEITRMKTAFNDDLLQLRAEKRRVLATLNELRAAYATVRARLGLAPPAGTAPLVLTVDEEPEALYVMDREKLEAYSRRRAEERAKAEEEKKAQRGFGADLAGAQARERSRGSSAAGAAAVAAAADDASKRPTKGSNHPSSPDRGSRQSTISGFAMRERMDGELKAKLGNVQLSPEEKEEREMERAILERDLRHLESSMAAITSAFNEKLEALRLRRADVDADLSLTCGRLTLLFREYELLLVFRSQDKKLTEALHAVRHEREETQRAIAAETQEAAAAEDRIRQLTVQLKATNTAAEALMEERCPSDKLGYLRRVYYRALKRRRHGEAADDDDDITSDDEDEDEDDGIGEEVRPTSCPVDTWERMLADREARLDITDAIDAAKSTVAATHKKIEKGEHAVQQLAERLKTCRHEIDLLDAQKRKELNLLNTVVPLRLSQVCCLNSAGRVPANLRDASVVVIADEQVAALRRRIYELAEQKQLRHDEVASMTVELQQLKEAREAARRVYVDWQAKVTEVMLLKFGQHVDLEMLESCGSSWAIEAKKEELRHLELRWARAVRKVQNQIADLRTRLQGKVFENTGLLHNLGDLEMERQQMDAALSQATSQTVQHYRGHTVASKQERSVLRELIAAQQEELDALSAEIAMLKRKGGHVYSPAMM